MNQRRREAGIQIKVSVNEIGSTEVEFKHKCTVVTVTIRSTADHERLAHELRSAARKLVKGLGSRKGDGDAE